MEFVTIIICISLVIIMIGISVFKKQHKKKKDKFVVLGTQFARAGQIEKLRKLKGGFGVSPIPGWHYDAWRRETNLVNPVLLPLDSQLVEICTNFSISSEAERIKIRNSINMDELYTLLMFSKRAAVFAIRKRDKDWLVKGLSAVAMIDLNRVDYRDVISSINLLHHVANRIEINDDNLLTDIADLSGKGVADLMFQFSRQPKKDKDIRISAGYMEIETPKGIGFVHCYNNPYHPTYKIDLIIQEISDLLAADQYPNSDIAVASDIPTFWLKAGNNRVLNKALGNVKAVVSVSANLQPQANTKNDYQMLIVFLAELSESAYAKSLCRIAETSRPSTFCIHGVVVESLFCMIVARSLAQGVEPFETTEGLKRFMLPISEILNKYVV